MSFSFCAPFRRMHTHAMVWCCPLASGVCMTQHRHNSCIGAYAIYKKYHDSTTACAIVSLRMSCSPASIAVHLRGAMSHSSLLERNWKLAKVLAQCQAQRPERHRRARRQTAGMARPRLKSAFEKAHRAMMRILSVMGLWPMRASRMSPHP